MLYEAFAQDDQRSLLDRVDHTVNNSSIVLRFDYRGFRILLPGNTNSLGYEHLPAELLQADLFKVGHHRQKDAITAKLL